jgi:hypothetical protein
MSIDTPHVQKLTDWFCSDVSREAGEPLIGTATRADVWFLIEFGGAWEKKALEASTLSQSVKDHLKAAQYNLANARIELIKQEGYATHHEVAFFVARCSDHQPALYQFTLHSYDELLALDLVAIAAGDPRYDDHLITTPMYIVCTNGLRDPCCARNGLVVYHMLAERAASSVWQATHLGGHRLAANLVVLPHGLFYGRVTADDISDVLKPDHIHLRAFRGRTCYDAPAQAAEIFLRETSGSTQLTGLTLAGTTEASEKKWEVVFTSDVGGIRYRVLVERVAADIKTYDSCGEEQPREVQKFRLLSIT